jgi:hypothetical protein
VQIKRDIFSGPSPVDESEAGEVESGRYLGWLHCDWPGTQITLELPSDTDENDCCVEDA